jgi:F-type H+-transporting ATPase subunit a
MSEATMSEDRGVILLYTWLVMALLVGGSWLITRRLSVEVPLSRWQHFLEVLVLTMANQIREATRQPARRYLPFIGTLFLFIATSNLLAVGSVVLHQDARPLYFPPTGSLSTTTALALCVFFAVPLYGLTTGSPLEYLKHYIQPSVFMLPFNIIGELSRTLALAVRLFGNVLSGTKIAGILLAFVPLLVPIPMTLLGLLTGMIQAYIFAILALVYIASACRAQEAQGPRPEEKNAIPPEPEQRR